MSKAGAITNSERKDRSIRLWGGAEPSAATQPPLPARARVSPPCACRLPGPVDEPWARRRARAAGAGAGPRVCPERDGARDRGDQEPGAVRRVGAACRTRFRLLATCLLLSSRVSLHFKPHPSQLSTTGIGPETQSLRLARGPSSSWTQSACKAKTRTHPPLLPPPPPSHALCILQCVSECVRPLYTSAVVCTSARIASSSAKLASISA